MGGIIAFSLSLQVAKASGTIYIRSDGSIDPPTAPIQRNGSLYTFTDNIYNSIIVSKSNIVVDGAGFTLQGPGATTGSTGVRIGTPRISYVTIRNMMITEWGTGILSSDYDHYSSYHTISKNDIINNGYGVYLGGSVEYCMVSLNEISYNTVGVCLSGDFTVANTIWENNISHNEYGIQGFIRSYDNKFYHNNLIDNGQQVNSNWSELDGPQVWDNGYPSGGNYWSDYNGLDVFSGPHQNDTGSDGIGDIQYLVSPYHDWRPNVDVDHYPLMEFWDWGPPKIESVSTTPAMPNYDEGVVVLATITDDTGVDKVELSYTQGPTWHNASMEKVDDSFNALIPCQPYGTLVQYKIYANDTRGNQATSALRSYTVGDFIAPEVGVSQTPTHPTSTQLVKIHANVTEPASASGVATVLFSYRINNAPWWNTTMTFNQTLGLYESTIPPTQQTGDLVEYFIQAIDNAGNSNATGMKSYIAGLPGDYNGDGIVNAYDLGMVGKIFGARVGSSLYEPNVDFNSDGIINAYDLAIVGINFGRRYP